MRRDKTGFESECLLTGLRRKIWPFIYCWSDINRSEQTYRQPYKVRFALLQAGLRKEDLNLSVPMKHSRACRYANLFDKHDASLFHSVRL